MMMLLKLMKHDDDEADPNHAEDCNDHGAKSHSAKVEAERALKRRGQAFKISFGRVFLCLCVFVWVCLCVCVFVCVCVCAIPPGF